jgi:hypothetical protein
MDRAFSSLSAGLEKFDSSRRTDAEGMLLNAATRYSDPQALRAAIADGSVFQGIDRNLVGREALGALDSRATSLLSQATSQEALTQAQRMNPLLFTGQQQIIAGRGVENQVAAATASDRIRAAALANDSTVANIAQSNASTGRTLQDTEQNRLLFPDRFAQGQFATTAAGLGVVNAGDVINERRGKVADHEEAQAAITRLRGLDPVGIRMEAARTRLSTGAQAIYDQHVKDNYASAFTPDAIAATPAGLPQVQPGTAPPPRARMNPSQLLQEAGLGGAPAGAATATSPVYSSPETNGRLNPNQLAPLGIGNHRVAPHVVQPFNNLRSAALQAGFDIVPTDSYRDMAGQERVAREKGRTSQGGLAAEPGHSRHGHGEALDLGLRRPDGSVAPLSPQAANWLRENGPRHGMETIANEPWHWQVARGGQGQGQPASRPSVVLASASGPAPAAPPLGAQPAAPGPRAQAAEAFIAQAAGATPVAAVTPAAPVVAPPVTAALAQAAQAPQPTGTSPAAVAAAAAGATVFPTSQEIRTTSREATQSVADRVLEMTRARNQGLPPIVADYDKLAENTNPIGVVVKELLAANANLTGMSEGELTRRINGVREQNPGMFNLAQAGALIARSVDSRQAAYFTSEGVLGDVTPGFAQNNTRYVPQVNEELLTREMDNLRRGTTVQAVDARRGEEQLQARLVQSGEAYGKATAAYEQMLNASAINTTLRGEPLARAHHLMEKAREQMETIRAETLRVVPRYPGGTDGTGRRDTAGNVIARAAAGDTPDEQVRGHIPLRSGTPRPGTREYEQLRRERTRLLLESSR